MAILDEYGNPYSTPRRLVHAADRNPLRGPVFPTRANDLDRLISSLDLATVRSLSQRMFLNMGVCRDALKQKASYSIGSAWLPTYTGESDFADGKQISTFLRKVWFPNMNVKGGVQDWQKTLELTSIAMDRDGDVFWLKIVGTDGFPRIQVIPAHRVGNCGASEKITEGKFKGCKIIDGVILYASGRPAAYRVLTGENMATFMDVDAVNIIPFFDPDSAEQNRGFPAFMHALEDMVAMLASTGDERIRQMIVSRLHLTIFNESGGPDLDDPRVAMEGTSDGSGAIAAQTLPGGIVYLTAGCGEKIEQVKHETPGAMWSSFQDRLTKMSLASVWPASLVWNSTGQGTAERAEVVKARRYVTTRQRNLYRPALNAFAWAYSVFQKANRVPLLDHPFSWEFSKPPRLSVDDGRESKMEVEEWRAGLRNTDEITEARGMTEDEFYQKRAYSVAKRKVIARQVSEEISASSGYDIEIEDREMAMLTANEMGKPEEPEIPEPPTTKSNEDPED